MPRVRLFGWRFRFAIFPTLSMIRAFFQTHSLTGDSDDLRRRIVSFPANIKTVPRLNDRDTSNLFISDRSREGTRLCAKYIDTELLPPDFPAQRFIPEIAAKLKFTMYRCFQLRRIFIGVKSLTNTRNKIMWRQPPQKNEVYVSRIEFGPRTNASVITTILCGSRLLLSGHFRVGMNWKTLINFISSI